MLVQALLQTSLVLWLAQQTLQGGVKPQGVSWGRVLPARGVGIGVKPGVGGALGALGSRYGSKAMKSGPGQYPGAQHGVGGYGALGLGGRAGLKQGGYGNQGPYGASLGTANGLGLGYGQGGKPYGAGHGNLPAYGPLAGIGHPGARPGVFPGYPTGKGATKHKPGVSSADLGGPEMASLGRAAQDLKREKFRALGDLYRKQEGRLGPEMPNMRRINILGPTVPELHAEREAKSIDPLIHSPSLGPTTPLDGKMHGLSVSQAQGVKSNDPAVSRRKGTVSHEAAMATGSVQTQMPVDKDNIRSLGAASSRVQNAGDHRSSIQQAQNCASPIDLSDVLKINHDEFMGSETQMTHGLLPRSNVGKESKHLGSAITETQKEKTDQLPLSQAQDVRGNVHSAPQSQGSTSYLSVVADKQGVKGLVTEDTNGFRGTISVEHHSRGSASLQIQAGGRYGPVIPGASGTQSLGIPSVGGGQGAQDLTADGQDVKHHSQAEHDVFKLKTLQMPGQTGRNTQATRYFGGAGNYMGAGLGAGGFGAGLGQGAYLGGAAGKHGAAALGQGGYPQGVAGKSTGYGDGAAGHLGAMAGNGFGYGNGYSDGYGAGLGYPAELADVAEGKTGKREGAFGAGLEPTGGKYGGAAQSPYGNVPVIPAGLEGDGSYPYAAQHLSLGAEGTKTANKYGYGAHLGPPQDALAFTGEQTGKYGGANGNGYKG
ncbi:keratin, type I cytoskeletal 9 isoform X2 [Mugil cephalus]|uniref:keratin, type I cytoskeletal 9 isoform X2 n=1 Tax=Mugil cephalus TaxID=48193 RepID=UPI001FB59B0D|nr:keratin, type I cytoskeletal 9 isoform X2 [Mugil cephalus]